MGSGLSGRLGNQRVVTSGTTGAWNPANVPEVAAGYFWLAASGTGIGTAGFKVPEGNGHTTFDLLQATVANQPAVLTELGGTQYRMGKSGSAAPARLAVSGNVTAGWTGPTYIAGWFRLPDASGDITGVGGLLRHNLGAGARRIQFNLATGPDEVSGFFSADGTATPNRRFGNPFVGGDWHWIEHVFDPSNTLGGTTTADRMKLFDNFALVAAGSVSAAQGASLFDATAPLTVCCQSAVASNADTTDWATLYYCNGIPSLPNREALYRHLAPR